MKNQFHKLSKVKCGARKQNRAQILCHVNGRVQNFKMEEGRHYDQLCHHISAVNRSILMKFGKQMCVLNVSHVTCLHMKLYLEVSQGAATTTGIGKVVGWGHWNTRTYKKLS